jgi:carbonic anhydrase
LEKLLRGYERFRREAFPKRKDHFHLLAESQAPETLFITCSDSRVVPDLILQSEPGELFIARQIGNVVPPSGSPATGVTSTVEYAVRVLGVRHLIICGHSDCGAIKAAMEKKKLEGLPLATQWLKYVESAWQFRDPSAAMEDAPSQLKALIHANVVAQMHNVKTHAAVASGLAHGTLQVHGWYYDILSGEIEKYDEPTRTFMPLLP